MVELMLGISLLTIVLSGLTHAVPILQKSIYDGRNLREEIAQVEQVLQIITRSVQQAGFENIIKSQSQSTRSQKSPMQGIQVFQQATLTTDKVGKTPIPQSYLAGRRQTDAMLIQHETFGHFDCVGRKITDKRTHQGLSRIGFFVQFRGNKSNAIGTLMCQSLTNNSQIQNDAILTGVDDFLIYLEEGVVIIELTMQSARQYQTSIALQNQIIY
jgi:hypothetical protein